MQAVNDSLARPYLPPTLRLRQRRQDHEKEIAAGSEEKGFLPGKTTDQPLPHVRAKREAFEQRKAIGLARYTELHAQPGPTERTQDLFAEKFPSFLDQIESGEDARRRTARSASESRSHAREAGGVNGLSSSSPPRKAEATAFGFFSVEEEKAYLADQRRRAGELREAEVAEKAALRASTTALKAFQKQQAEERSRRMQEEKAAERAGAQQHLADMAADDAQYLDYIRSQIPPDMHPVLVEKAMRMD
ncbi:unnamed protein product [Phytomonas sp. EM1]|nr:unnamed protein product [Phytomonas sp. EM1]|eukprot:CCW61837.1 unnamed protein product [Phytomonas sp. isolate EM1]